MKDIRGTAFVLTEEYFHTVFAKTAHGLIRHSKRFEVKAVIDRYSSGRDAGEVLDQKFRGIPICNSLQEAIEKNSIRADYCIVGVATAGGKLPASLIKSILEAIDNGMSIICGLHQFMNDIPSLKEAANAKEVDLIDIRKPRPTSELRFWSGEIMKLKTPRITVLGMDCAVGKRTTCSKIHELCRSHGIKSEMLFTGQTGWLQGYKYGFIFDATINDFISGEVERAILDCAQKSNPDLILIEGQSSLRNPSGPCGSEFLLSGDVKGVILQHVPFRKEFEIAENIHYPIPTLESEIELIRFFEAKTLAVCLNGEAANEKELIAYQKDLEKKLSIPVIRPLREGVEKLLPIIREYMNTCRT